MTARRKSSAAKAAKSAPATRTRKTTSPGTARKPARPGRTRAAASPPLNEAWRIFATRLQGAIAALPENHYLILSVPDRHRFVQFAGEGEWGILAECVSNHYLPAGNRLSAADQRALRRLGWEEPNQEQLGTKVRGEADGSPNWYRHFRRPLDLEALGTLVARTFVEVYGVRHPGTLRYDSFAREGGKVIFPDLPIEREPPSPAATSEEDERPLLLQVADAASVEADDDGVELVLPSQMALTVDGIRLRVVVEERRFLARVIAPLFAADGYAGNLHEAINTMNAEHIAFGYTYMRDGEVRYAAELLLNPYVPALVPVTLKIAASVVRGLRRARDEDATTWTVIDDA